MVALPGTIALNAIATCAPCSTCTRKTWSDKSASRYKGECHGPNSQPATNAPRQHHCACSGRWGWPPGVPAWSSTPRKIGSPRNGRVHVHARIPIWLQLKLCMCIRRWLTLAPDHRSIGWASAPGKMLSHKLNMDDIIEVRGMPGRMRKEGEG